MHVCVVPMRSELSSSTSFSFRVNDLEKALKVLTLTHNTLQTEAEKKETAMEKMRHFVTTLQQDNYKLQEVPFLY